MRAMNSETVDLIATDPPFNKGRDFHATPDSLAKGASFQDRWSWENDVHEEWTDQIQNDWPKVWEVINSSRNSWGDDMGAYLCFMGVRLIAMRRLLKPTGSIYLHCDPTASHYLKMLMDAIFGRKNFKNEVVWGYRTQGVAMRWWPRKHDILLLYSKGAEWTFHPQQERQFYNKAFRHTKIDRNGRHYVDTYLRDIWDHDETKPTISQSQERTGYPTQKPLALYERIIQASSNAGDLVLDPFCGCATTLVACERLDPKRQWVGIDIWDKAQDAVVERLEKEGLTAPKYTRRTKKARQQFLFAEEFTFTDAIPDRTDGGETSAPYLKTKSKLQAKETSDGLTNQERKQKLLDAKGHFCQGCGHPFDDSRYLELDHNTPRASGGSNNLSNRLLLCRPCNGLKSNIYTLDGLIKENKKRGYMRNLKLVNALKK